MPADEIDAQDAAFLHVATRWWFWLVAMPIVVGAGGFGLAAFVAVRNRSRIDIHGLLLCLAVAAPHVYLISQGIVALTTDYVTLQALLVAFGTLTRMASIRRLHPGFLGRVMRG